MAPEAVRERAMHRYYQPWLETFMLTEFEPAVVPPAPAAQAEAHRPRSSKDKALTAFAQLGCLRLNAKRCMVTLLGSTRQYIIAEATKSLSLLSDTQHIDGDELWFGNSFIEREAGISADAMYPDKYTARDSDGSSFTAPALVVSDISTHESYKTRGYAGRGISFYCGVPITTGFGHVIGVYTVTDDKPRDNLSATELRFLVDMSVIVIQHLEMVRNDRVRKRGERLINGIGGFMEGDEVDESPNVSPDSQLSNRLESSVDPDPANNNPRPDRSNPEGSTRSTKTVEFLGMVIADANALPEDSEHQTVPASDPPSGPLRKKSSGPDQGSVLDREPRPTPTARRGLAKNRAIRDSQRVFDRAAAILRYCLGTDGVIFLNASSANLSSGSRMETSGSVSRIHHSRSKERRRSEHRDQTRAEGLQKGAQEINSSMSSDDSATTQNRSDSSTSQKKRQQRCQVLGLSVLDPDKAVSVSEQSLRRLVRRYPKGKCFTFDQFGRPASSDEGSESVSAIDSFKDESDQASKTGEHVLTTNALLKALPGARNIVFLPLWDIGKERWHSGLVVWSFDPGSLTNVEDNMVYLKVFSSAVMNEVNRIGLALSDTAKSTFLANISHELRSPLHGILGSIEFLHDTAMDDFQSSMVISVETCGKTLLDTVNHVLDYAKIHRLVKSHRQGQGATQDAEHSNNTETSLTEDFDMAIVVEEVVEAVYAGQVFRTVNVDALEGKSPVQTAANRAMQQRQERKANISKGAAVQKSAVRLTLNIDEHINWRVRSQPGAVRRIVMNILGNALKYTSKGSINVSLEVDRSHSKSSSNLHMLMQISDTGHGMSDDFMKNHAFTAFSQENSLATGTGLGLSIVRQIVDSLGGKVDLSSEKDVGTEVRIWLSLPKSRKEVNADSESNAIPEMRERTKGYEMCMLIPYDDKSTDNGGRSLVPMPTIEWSMRNLISQWFRMKVTSTKTMEGLSPNFFIYPEPPPNDYLMDFHGTPNKDEEVPVIILCANAFEAASLRSNGVHFLTDIGRIIEVIAQPCGPQKLAKVLHRCMQRVEMLKRDQPKKKSSPHVPLSFDRDKQDSRGEDNSAEQGNDSPGQSEDGEQLGQPAPNSPPDSPVLPKLADSARKMSSEGKSRLRKPLLRRISTSDETVTLSQSDVTDREVLPQTPGIDKPRVLVVDDNYINLHLLVTFVRKTGHPYESATDGLKALETYKKSVQNGETGRRAFKYILMDISMPVMDGMSATKEIRKFERENNLEPPATIIALTGMGSDIARNEARDAGFDQFLNKPIKFRDLVKLLV